MRIASLVAFVLCASVSAGGCASDRKIAAAKNAEAKEVEAVKAGLRVCGLTEEQFSVEYVTDFQSAEARVGNVAVENDQLIACLGNIEPSPVFTFQDLRMEKALNAYLATKSPKLEKYLAGDGSWDRMSVPNQRALALKMSRECHLPPDRLLITEDGVHFVPSPADNYDAVGCLIEKMRKVGGLKRMGFVGNEAYVTEDN